MVWTSYKEKDEWLSLFDEFPEYKNVPIPGNVETSFDGAERYRLGAIGELWFIKYYLKQRNYFNINNYVPIKEAKAFKQKQENEILICGLDIEIKRKCNLRNDGMLWVDKNQGLHRDLYVFIYLPMSKKIEPIILGYATCDEIQHCDYDEKLRTYKVPRNSLHLMEDFDSIIRKRFFRNN